MLLLDSEWDNRLSEFYSQKLALKPIHHDKRWWLNFGVPVFRYVGFLLILLPLIRVWSDWSTFSQGRLFGVLSTLLLVVGCYVACHYTGEAALAAVEKLAHCSEEEYPRLEKAADASIAAWYLFIGGYLTAWVAFIAFLFF